MKIKEDRRIMRTKEMIFSAFKELMLNHEEYLKISVTELCEKANISRRTFYSYFDSIDDLLKMLQKEAIESFLIMTKGADVFNNPHLVVESFFKMNLENPLYEKMLLSSKYDFIRRSSRMGLLSHPESIITDSLKVMQPFFKEMLLSSYHLLIISCYRDWAISGKRIPVDTMVEEVTNALKYGLSYYVEGFKK